METYNIFQAKAQLSSLIQKVLNGEEVIISKAGKPLVELKPLKKNNRELGLWKNKAHISDDFESPLPEEFLAYFGGGEQ